MKPLKKCDYCGGYFDNVGNHPYSFGEKYCEKCVGILFSPPPVNPYSVEYNEENKNHK
jgi:hypothetical protein